MQIPTIEQIVAESALTSEKRIDFARLEVNNGYDMLLKIEYLLGMYIDMMPSPIPDKHYHNYANALITLHELRQYISKRES